MKEKAGNFNATVRQKFDENSMGAATDEVVRVVHRMASTRIDSAAKFAKRARSSLS